MGKPVSLKEELDRYLEEIVNQADRVQAYADFVLNGARHLQEAASAARERLANQERPTAADELDDNGRELASMTIELGRLHESLISMKEDCGRV